MDTAVPLIPSVETSPLVGFHTPALLRRGDSRGSHIRSTTHAAGEFASTQSDRESTPEFNHGRFLWILRVLDLAHEGIPLVRRKSDVDDGDSGLWSTLRRRYVGNGGLDLTARQGFHSDS